MKQIFKVIDWLTDKAAVLSGYITAAMMIIVCYDVTMRYCFNRPTIFAQDVVEYLIVYATFLAAPLLLKTDSHVRVSIVTDQFPTRLRAIARMGTSALGLAVCIVLFFWSLAEIWELIRENEWIQRPLSVPKFTTRLPIPFGSFLLSIHFIRAIARFAIDLKEE
jgi:TRAP-type C4-dicarboxylate transport system permease small subunit